MISGDDHGVQLASGQGDEVVGVGISGDRPDLLGVVDEVDTCEQSYHESVDVFVTNV